MRTNLATGFPLRCCLGLLVLLPVGCQRSDQASNDAAKGGLERSIDAGPVHVIVRTDRGQALVAERVRLTIEATAPEGATVQMPTAEAPPATQPESSEEPNAASAAAGQTSTPAFQKGLMGGVQLGEFLVKDVREQPPVWLDGRRHYVQEYALECYTSGDQTIPPLTLRYLEQSAVSQPSRAAGALTTKPAEARAGTEIKAPPLTLRITSALAGEKDPARYRDIKGVVDVSLPAQRRWLRWAMAAVVLVALATVATLLWLRKRGKRVEPEIPPGTWAFAQFRRLEQDRLVEQGRVHDFYFRLTDIVRQYIERRFALMAPERTTQEFLREAQASPVLAPDHKRLLSDFLQTADMVKFALHEPGRDDCERALADARCFVEETAYTPERPEGGPDDFHRRDAGATPPSATPANVTEGKNNADSAAEQEVAG